MDISTIILLQEEQQLVAANLDQNGAQQGANHPHHVGAISLDYLSTAAKSAHSVASVSHEKTNPKPSANPASTPSHKLADASGGGASGGSPAGNYPAPSGRHGFSDNLECQRSP